MTSHTGWASTGPDEPKSEIKLYETTKSIFAKANMNLRKWRNNNRDVNEFIEGKLESIEKSSEDTSYASLMLKPSKETENKVLGIPWYTKHEPMYNGPSVVIHLRPFAHLLHFFHIP